MPRAGSALALPPFKRVIVNTIGGLHFLAYRPSSAITAKSFYPSPYRLVLRKPEPRTIRIEGSDGHPIAGARITPRILDVFNGDTSDIPTCEFRSRPRRERRQDPSRQLARPIPRAAFAMDLGGLGAHVQRPPDGFLNSTGSICSRTCDGTQKRDCCRFEEILMRSIQPRSMVAAISIMCRSKNSRAGPDSTSEIRVATASKSHSGSSRDRPVSVALNVRREQSVQSGSVLSAGGGTL